MINGSLTEITFNVKGSSVEAINNAFKTTAQYRLKADDLLSRRQQERPGAHEYALQVEWECHPPAAHRVAEHG